MFCVVKLVSSVVDSFVVTQARSHRLKDASLPCSGSNMEVPLFTNYKTTTFHIRITSVLFEIHVKHISGILLVLFESLSHTDVFQLLTSFMQR